MLIDYSVKTFKQETFAIGGYLSATVNMQRY